MSWNDFEHSIWKQLKSESLTDRSEFILAVSGGLDSMVLVQVLRNLKPQAHFVVAHYHHGKSDSVQINLYRDKAQSFVQDFCEKNNLQIVTAKSLEILKTEDEFRQKRFQFFSEIRAKFPEAVFVTAHHKDDLLETLLLKMIRGAGPEALENFKFWNRQILRPLLLFTKSEILTYAHSMGVSWVDDPSNEQSDYLRNWLRNEWLSELAAKIPGSINNLTSSLQKLINEANSDNHAIDIRYDTSSDNIPTKATLNRTEFLQLSHSDQLKCLARALKGIGQRQFSQGQLEEIIKRLDKNQKDIIFSVAGVNWFINAQQVVLELS